MPCVNVSMNDVEFGRLQEVIYERSGIHFQKTRRYVLESRLTRRLEELGFDDFGQYVMFLTSGPYQQDEFQEMFNRITINETSFFRNEPQLQYLEQTVLPTLIEARKDVKRLRIWSAACSTGEEPYTLAIQIHRSLGVRLADWNVEILGTDISEKVLLQAEKACYSDYSLRSIPAFVRWRYFKEAGGQHQLDPIIRSMVRFERLNLKEAHAARRFGVWDIILCRNVLIYFDDAMRTHCAKLFHEQLADDGCLFLGHSESLRNIDVPFDLLPVPQAFAYVKSPGSLKTRKI